MTRVPDITTGKKLLKYRTAAGITQEQLAAYLGTTYETISNYERDVREIRPYMARYLRYFFTYGPIDAQR